MRIKWPSELFTALLKWWQLTIEVSNVASSKFQIKTKPMCYKHSLNESLNELWSDNLVLKFIHTLTEKAE